jgi:2-polyprenyl-3-methyl-5-hydroxy-6-metoxy-1,4-benzoquinol methylase
MTRLHRRVYDRADFVDDYLVSYAPYLRNAFTRGLERLGRACPPSGEPLLDVGCSFGYFLWLARDAGYAVKGIELAPGLAREAGRRYGIDVWPGTLLRHPFAAGSFAVVTLWDVLEHCADVRDVVDRMIDLLRPEGLLSIRVPDFSFASAELPASFIEPFVDEVFPLDFGYHGAHFSQASLDLLLADCGLEVIDRWPSQVDEYTPKDRDVYRETVARAEELGIACEQNVICRHKGGE